ncbi:MAG: hypothetical protein AAFX57_13240, partial [Bacteroidota bacterium]
ARAYTDKNRWEFYIPLLFSWGNNNGACPTALLVYGRRCGQTQAVATGEGSRYYREAGAVDL